MAAAVGHPGLPSVPTAAQATAAAQAVYDHLLGGGEADYACGVHGAGTLLSYGSQFLPSAAHGSSASDDQKEQLNALLVKHFLSPTATGDGAPGAAAIPWGLLTSLLVQVLLSLFGSPKP